MQYVASPQGTSSGKLPSTKTSVWTWAYGTTNWNSRLKVTSRTPRTCFPKRTSVCLPVTVHWRWTTVNCAPPVWKCNWFTTVMQVRTSSMTLTSTWATSRVNWNQWQTPTICTNMVLHVPTWVVTSVNSGLTKPQASSKMKQKPNFGKNHTDARTAKATGFPCSPTQNPVTSAS